MPASTERRYKGERVSQRVERVAAWVMSLRERRPLLGYGEIQRLTIAHFGCGKRTVEQAQKLVAAGDAAALTLGRDRLTGMLIGIYEEARSKGDAIGAVRALHEVSRINGMHAPQKHEHSGTVARLDLANLSDDELEEELSRVAAIEKRVAERDD